MTRFPSPQLIKPPPLATITLSRRCHGNCSEESCTGEGSGQPQRTSIGHKTCEMMKSGTTTLREHTGASPDAKVLGANGARSREAVKLEQLISQSRDHIPAWLTATCERHAAGCGSGIDSPLSHTHAQTRQHTRHNHTTHVQLPQEESQQMQGCVTVEECAAMARGG